MIYLAIFHMYSLSHIMQYDLLWMKLIGADRVSKGTEYISILILGLGLIFSAASALADSPAPPRDYTKITENGEYIFVMLRPDDPSIKSQSDLRENYKISGLYRNDGSGEPLWAVDWYAFGVIPSSDGKHLIRWGPWASTTDQLALSFYEDGNEIKRYLIWELVCDETKLKRSVSHFQWVSESSYDDNQGTLYLKTSDEREFRFSIATGEIQDDRVNDELIHEKPILCPKEGSETVFRCPGKRNCVSKPEDN